MRKNKNTQKMWKVIIIVDYNSDPINVEIDGRFDSEEFAKAVGKAYLATHDMAIHYCDILVYKED